MVELMAIAARLPTFTVSTNNRACTVFKLFVEVIRKYGLPSRVRSDQGLENVRIAQYILEHRDIERGQFHHRPLNTQSKD